MEPENIREEFEQIVESLVEIFHRLCHTEEGENIFLHWRPICLRQDGENRSIVRYLADNMPRGSLVFDPISIYYRSVIESVFTRRSLIREIGSRLPLQPSKRPYFHMLHKPAYSADIQSRGLKEFHRSQYHSTPFRDVHSLETSAFLESMDESCRENVCQNSVVISDDAVRKISALEDELNRLRAQIAGFVLKQDTEPETTSMVPPPAVPPMPPPPPPLPGTTFVSPTPRKYGKPAPVKEGSVLDMAAILKDLNQVKLKAIERSPGGTPIRRAPHKTKASDPASIIADALKSKFAKSRKITASPDKENLQSPESSFGCTPSPQSCSRKPLVQKVKQRQSPCPIALRI